MAEVYDVVYDNEQFDLDDDLTRKQIYKPISVRAGTESCIVFNLTASHFKEGATQISHLKEPYAAFFYKVFNLCAHAIGNKKIDVIVPSQEMKKKKFAEAMAEVNEMNQAFDAWYGRCSHGDRIGIDVETLFDATEKTKVAGFRFWIYAKIVRHVARQVVPMNASPSVLVPLQSLGMEPTETVDVLSTAMRHSLREVRALAFNYGVQREKLLNGRGRGKPKAPTAKQHADAALYPLYNFIQYDSLLKCHTGLLRRYFTSDTSRVATIDGSTQFPVFKDSREIMSVQYNIEDPSHASHLIADMFTKEAAMFYHVRRENIIQEQRNINTYLRSTERIAAYDADKMLNVTDLMDLNLRDSALGAYYNEQTTYQLKNEQITPEFFHRMPLPHRIGAILPTRQHVGPTPQEVEANAGEDDGIQQIMALNEDDDDDEEDDIRGEKSSVSEEEPIPDYAYDEAWLAENDHDGKIAQRIFGDPAIYGYTEVALKPLGLHQVKYSVTKSRMLACKDAEITTAELENPTNEVKNKFMDRRSDHVTMQIRSTIVREGGKPCNVQKLLVYHYASKESPSAQMSAIDAGVDIDTATNNVYRASTLNYIVNKTRMGTNAIPAYQSEEETAELSQDERDETLLRSESGEYADETVRGVRIHSNKQLEQEIPFMRRPNNKNYSAEWESYVANALLDVFMPVIEKRRPRGNKMEDINSAPDLIREEDWMLERDIELRLAVLNKRGFRHIDNEFFNPKTHEIPKERYAEYKAEKRPFIDATLVEEWHEFFTSIDVSYANEGIRDDWRKATTHILDGKKCINHAHHMRVSRLDVTPYHQYKIWCYELFAVVLDVHYNQKIMYNNYIAKYHHCRWNTDSTDPKNNIINHGDNMGGKSFILRNVKKTCPSMVGDMLTQITDKAFNVDRNLNDMLIIIEELENKYLGIVPGMKPGSGASGESDALTFFKNRLTSGVAAVLHFYENEEMGGRRDCKQAKSSCQGSYLCATNARLADADRHLLSRFTLLSVPKCFGDKGKGGPKVGHKDMKHQFGTEERQHDKIYEEHKDIHRLYFFVEKCIKANVINNMAYGTAIDSANIMINQILNTMEADYGIKTNDARKRNTILEFARSLCISFACWNAFTSPALRHLMYDPLTGEYIGINPRLIARGIFPYLVITKDMVIDALTSLSGLWRHDHLKNVMMAVVESTNLTKPIAGKYRYVVESELEGGTGGGGGSSSTGRGNHNASRAASDAMNTSHSRNMVGIATQNGVPVYINAVADHNYVSLVEPRYDTIYRNLSKQLGELQISSNDIEKILKELSEETYDIPIRGYILRAPGSPLPSPPLANSGATVNTTAAVDETPYGSLVLETVSRGAMKPKIVVIDTCPKMRKPRVSILVAYLKDQLPTVLSDNIVYDLRRLTVETDKLAEREKNGEECVDDDDDESSSSFEDGDEEGVRLSTKKRKSSAMAYQEEEEEEENPMDERPVEETLSNMDDDTLSILIDKLQKAASYDIRSEAPLIKAIATKYCNGIKDLAVLTPQMEDLMRQEYATLFSGYVPWDNHVTADHPSPISTEDVYRISVAQANKHLQNKISHEITFFDTVKSLTLKRKGVGPVILPNYAYVSPSAVATLSIFDPLIQENDIMKSTQRIYNRSSSWALHEDIDFTCCKAHLANLAYEPLDTDDVRFRCLNFPPYHYQIHADYSRTRLEKHKKDVQTERAEEMATAEKDGDTALEKVLRREAEDEHVASVMCEYPLCSMLSKVNHQGNIINHMIFDRDTNSVIFHEMLLANCKSMANDFELRHTHSLKCKKRLEFADQESRLEARKKLRDIYKERLPLTKSLNAKAHQNTQKMAQTMTQKARQVHTEKNVLRQSMTM